jgi:hypothetical protein
MQPFFLYHGGKWRLAERLGQIARFPAVGNAASIQAGSRDIREIPDQADLSHLDRRMTPGCSQQQGAFVMCDYSLDFVASRPARVGDKLVSTRFRNSVTRGFAEIGEPNVAVCLLPGTEIAFERDVECGAAFRLFRNRSLRQKVARFRQVNLDQPTAHHDALEFPDGKIALVTDLCEGQHATVLQLPAQPTIAAEANAEKHIAYVE